MLLDTNFDNVAAAKMLGLDAHRANILSEFAEENLHFNGLGHLIAGTPNDEVNSIAAFRFIHQFGRAGVWQISPGDREKHHRTAAAEEVRSRICFEGSPDHATLSRMAEAGGKMKKTQITDLFDFAQFQSANPGAVVLFLEDSKGLKPAPAELPPIPPGTTVFALVPAAA
jgi:Trk K+ transport system NAD-binding subunit